MKRSGSLAVSLVLLLVVFVAGAFAARGTNGSTSKAPTVTSSKAVVAPSAKKAVAYPGNLRFFTVQRAMEEGEIPSDELIEFNPFTGEVIDTQVMTLDGDAVFGATELAVDPSTGDVYIIVQTEVGETSGEQFYLGSTLGIIDVDTGEITPVAELETSFPAMAFDNDGNGYIVTGLQDCEDCESSNPNSLFSLDKETGELTLIQALMSEEGHALAFHPVTGDLYHWVGEGMEVMTDPEGEPTEIEIDDNLEDSNGAIYIGNDEFLYNSYNGRIYVITTDGDVTFVDDVGIGTHAMIFTGSLINEVNDGGAADYNIIIPYDGENDGETYTFECTDGLPDGAVCEFDPNEVTIDEAPAGTTLTIHTDGTASLMPRNMRSTFAMWLMLPGFAVIGLVLGRKNTRVRNSMMLLLLLSMLIAMPACSGESERFGDDGGNGDLALVTVTATSENDTQTFQVALNVI